MRRRCPRCGKGDQFESWFKLFRRCTFCQLEFEISSGDTWAFWILGDRVFVAVAIAAFYFGVRPESSEGRLAYFALMIGVIILTMPQRKGVCIALDYFLRVKFSDRSS